MHVRELVQELDRKATEARSSTGNAAMKSATGSEPSEVR